MFGACAHRADLCNGRVLYYFFQHSVNATDTYAKLQTTKVDDVNPEHNFRYTSELTSFQHYAVSRCVAAYSATSMRRRFISELSPASSTLSPSLGCSEV